MTRTKKCARRSRDCLQEESDSEEVEEEVEEDAEVIARTTIGDMLLYKDPSAWDYTNFCRFLHDHRDYKLLLTGLPHRVIPDMLRDDLTAKYWIESRKNVELRPLAAACVCELRNIMIRQARQREESDAVEEHEKAMQYNERKKRKKMVVQVLSTSGKEAIKRACKEEEELDVKI